MRNTIILFLLALLALLLFSAGNLYAKEAVILYTGNTHAMLYPCSCPVERDGGIARRASLIKDIRKEYPDLLLLDCGSFTAGGGVLDEYAQNNILDAQRSELNLKAMELMGYDAVALSSDEFNFGKDFFLKNARKNNPAFLSANLDSDKVEPFILREVAGLKIAIIGLTDLAASQKSEGLPVKPVDSIVAGLISRLRGEGVQVVIVLSTLDIKESQELISKVKGIDILFTNRDLGHDKLPPKIGSTFIVRPSWQARKLGKLTLKAKGGKFLGCKDEKIRLSDKIIDDPDILAMLPRCYSDSNCKKEGLLGSCQNPGKLNAACLFVEPNKFKVTVISSRDCLVCNPRQTIDGLKKLFPGLDAEYLDLEQARGLIKDFSIETLPAYIIGPQIQKEPLFESFKENLELKNGMYLLNARMGGLSFFLNRQPRKGSFDLFFSLFDGNTAGMLSIVKEFKPDLHFLAVEKDGGFETMLGQFETEEYLRAVCVQKYYPDKFWDYLACRAKNIGSSWWEDCLLDGGLKDIKVCAKGQQGALLLKQNIALNNELQISSGPGYLVDNRQIFSSAGIPDKEELKKLIKK